MFAEQTLIINAPEKEKEDRTPAWVRKADWSSNDALLAFWSAHPPTVRDDFLKARAESYAVNFWAQIMSHRQRQHEIWIERQKLIDWQKKELPEMPGGTVNERARRKEADDDATSRLLSLRVKMRGCRDDIRRCIRYLRAVTPKQVNQFTRVDKLVGVTSSAAIASKPVHIIIPKPQTYTVISLWQPWASMVAWGLKQFETRHWSTSHRGVLLIHAAKRWTQAEKDYCRQYPFNRAIADKLGGAISDLPFGCIIAAAELVSILETGKLLLLSDEERAVGNFAPGRFAWKLANVKALKAPIPVKGGQGLFKWTGVIDG